MGCSGTVDYLVDGRVQLSKFSEAYKVRPGLTNTDGGALSQFLR